MSNSNAIAAVTATLIDLLGDMSDISSSAIATAHPPDKAAEGLQEGQSRINIFLYQTNVNPALRNMDLPHQVKPGERGHPPLALNLYYLLTPYSGDNNSTENQRLLGRAMSILHDNAVLNRETIKGISPNGNLHEQIESVRLTFQPLTLDEMSKLWNMFQTQYRTSVAYEASVVLIDSTRPVRTPLPVLRRRHDDQGIISQPDLIPPLPTITRLELPDKQPSLQLDDELIIHGHHLDGEQVKVRFMHPRLAEAIEASPQPEGTAAKITVQPSATPDAQTKYPAGLYRLAVAVSKTEAGKTAIRVSNEQPFSLAPRLTIPPDPIENDILTLRCNPEVWLEQRVALLLGSSEIAAQPRTNKTDILTFNIANVPAAKYLVRLRIDGVDSLPVQDYKAVPLTFDEAQMVTINE